MKNRFIHSLQDKWKLLKFLFAAKLAFLIVLGSVFHANATVTSQDLISLDLKDVPISKVLKVIENQYGYKFVFSNSLIDINQKINIRVSNKSIEEVINSLFDDSKISYKLLENKLIVIHAKQQFKVTGKVYEAGTYVPMPGVNVVEQGNPSNGTITNLNGVFELEVSKKDAKLVFSFIGFETQIIPVDTEKEMIINLKQEAQQITEVVKIGYGIVKKSNALGAISSVSNEDIENLPVSNIDQALQGKAAGVQVMSNSGAPGGSMTVRVRGMSTLNSGQSPLYVVDGVILGDKSFGKEGGQVPDNKSVIDFLDPNQIESVEVLKDASATAIFGARGSNGVVLITTKKGKSGEAKVSFNMYRGIQTLRKKYDILSPEQFRDYWNEYNTNSGRSIKPEFDPENELPAHTDWQEEIINIGSFGDLLTATPIENYNLAISGGSDKSTYYVSGTYFNQKGLLKKSSYKKYSLSIKGEHKINDRIKFGESLIVTKAFRDRSSEVSGIIRNMLIADPTASPYDSTGYWADLDNSGYGQNPVGIRDRFEYLYNNDRYFASIFVDATILPNLVFHSTVGYDVSIGDMQSFEPEYFINPQDKRDLAIYRKRDERWNNWDVENTLTYQRKFGEHDITAMVGYTFQKESFVDLRTTCTGFPYSEDYMLYPNVPNPGEVVTELGSSPMEYIISSTLGRLMYSYKDQLLISASVRRDGSSKFASNYRHGIFPGVSVGYVLSRLPVFENSKIVSFLKARAGWGMLGNQSIPPYRYSTQIGIGNNHNFGTDKTTYIGALPDGISNPNVKWEETTQENLAVDVGLFQNKLTLTVDVFRKTTNDMLFEDQIPFYVGVHSLERVSNVEHTGKVPILNVAEMRTKGLEFIIGYRTRIKNDLNMSCSFNLSTTKNEVLKLSDNISEYYSNADFRTGFNMSRTVVGRSAADFYGYYVEGIFDSYDEIAAHAFQGDMDPAYTDPTKEYKPYKYISPGDFKFKDVNGDGVIDTEDKTFLGSPLPKFTYGGNLTLDYKQFDLSVGIQGVYGNDIVNLNRYFLCGSVESNKFVEVLEDHWTEDNKDAKHPKVGVTRNNNMRFSNYYIEDGSYFRVKDITLGYTLSNTLATKLRVSSLRIYLSARNVFTITDYTGYDPEIGSSISWSSKPLDFGVDNGTYPQARVFSIGLNLNF